MKTTSMFAVLIIGTITAIGCSSKKSDAPADTMQVAIPPPAVQTPSSTASNAPDTATSMTTTTSEPEEVAEPEEKKEEAKPSKSSGSYDIDQYLADYERFMDSYIAAMKKVKNHDMSVMAEYTEMMQKATEMQKKLAGLQAEMTPANIEKMQKLNEKMMNAAKDM